MGQVSPLMDATRSLDGQEFIDVLSALCRRFGALGCWLHGVAGPHTYRSAFGGRLHKVVVQKLHGRIPDDWVVDHLCNTKGCCNPAHLQAVPHAENSRRGHLKASFKLKMFVPGIASELEADSSWMDIDPSHRKKQGEYDDHLLCTWG